MKFGTVEDHKEKKYRKLNKENRKAKLNYGSISITEGSLVYINRSKA